MFAFNFEFPEGPVIRADFTEPSFLITTSTVTVDAEAGKSDGGCQYLR